MIREEREDRFSFHPLSVCLCVCLSLNILPLEVIREAKLTTSLSNSLPRNPRGKDGLIAWTDVLNYQIMGFHFPLVLRRSHKDLQNI